MTQRERNLMKRYGMTTSDFDEWYNRQAGRCAICHTKPEILCVDHDHETGLIRGLLCNNCNRGIGLLGDNISRLRSAVGYLTAHNLRFADEQDTYNDCR